MLPSRQVLENTVQTFPPKDAVGPILIDVVRGPILPPHGSKEAERQLRLWDRHDFTWLWQGARSGVAKKIAAVPYSIDGPRAEADYYHEMLGNAHFGRGWQYFVKMGVRDYLTQDYGWICEIAGPGDPSGPIMGRVTGINHLDAGRCYMTGNPIYPVLYYDLWTNQLHRMHQSRIYMMVDDPDPDERYFGIGTCALRRAISIAQREMRMGQYIDARLDDYPQPGVTLLKGMSDKQFEMATNRYLKTQETDQRPVFGRSMLLGNPDGDIAIESVPFSVPPEGFDYQKYIDIDVNAVALALGIDRQELWELQGKALGSGAQSEVLAEKARGKTFADILSGMERFFNWAVLPDTCQIRFKYRDEQENQNQAAIDLQYAQIAQALTTIPGVSTEMILTVLATRSETYKDAFTDEQGNVKLPSDDRIPPQQQTDLPNSTPEPQAQGAQALAAPDQNQQARPQIPATTQKAFTSTSYDFKQRFASVLDGAIHGNMNRGQAERLMLSLLNRSGQQAYADGLREGGVTEALDDEELSEVQDWLADAIDYIDPLIGSAFDGTLPLGQVDTRAEMWSNKTLMQMFNAGRLSANKSGFYTWQLGKTEKHCNTCLRLNGQTHRLKNWTRKGLMPQSDKLDCGGFRCDCSLKRSAGPDKGAY